MAAKPQGPTSAVASVRKVALAGFLGSVIEWYDFTLFGVAAALVFNGTFFPSLDPLNGTLAAFATFGLGFFARPLGGILLGNRADKIGRTKVLVASLLLMGVATVLIGALPSYQSIGVAAPVLLVALRLLQGVGAGGELGPAATMVAEYAPDEKRGFYASLVGSGVALGVGLAAGTFALVGRVMSDAAFLDWGWRIPFLLSAVMVAVALYIRLRIGETPVFEAITETNTAAAAPAVEVFRTYRKNFLVAVGGRFAEVGPTYVFNTFALSYVAANLGSATRSAALTGVTIAGALGIITIPAFGALSDRVGRRPVFIAGSVFVGLIAFPFFWLLNTGSAAAIWFAFILAIPLGVYVMFAVQCSYYPELFGTRARASGMSLARELTAPLIAGPSPFVAAALVAWTGSYWPVAGSIVLYAAISAISVYLGDETRGQNLALAWPEEERRLTEAAGGGAAARL